jgi:DNA-binding LacI/PurR family transcriptional regulator/DNA-binding transcriptional regulator YhcF (GntR family)
MDSSESAYELIKKRLRAGEWAQGEPMPTLAALAQSCGVSRATVWKAVARLKRESLLHTMERGSIIAGPAGIPRYDSRLEGQAWERVRAQLGQEILSGHFTEEELPPVSKLSLKYGTAIDTLKKALRQLVREGLLVRRGRGYQPVVNSLRRHPPVIALISGGDRNRGIAIIGHDEALVGGFERECLRLGCRPQCEAFDHHTAAGLIEISAIVKGIDNLAGCIINMWDSGIKTYQQRWLDLVMFLADRKIPVIITDQAGNLAFPDWLLRHENVRVLRISGIRAGEIMAAALLRRNYHRIVYLAPFFKLDWAQNRYMGLNRYTERYGKPRARVELFALEEVADHVDLSYGLLGLDKQEMKAVYGTWYSREELADISAKMDEIVKNKAVRKMMATPVAGTVRDLARFMKHLAGKAHDQTAYDMILNTLGRIATMRAQDFDLRPFFKRVLDSGFPAVWVCANDVVAWSALSFLRSSGIRVPRDISVIGFDNYRESCEQQVSSYDFNIDGMIRQALQVIMNEKSLKSQPPVAEVDGYVVERMTTLRQGSVQALRPFGKTQGPQGSVPAL